MRVLWPIAAFCLFAVAASAQETPPPSVEAFGRLPAVADAAISPDGSKIALASTIDGVPRVAVVQLDGRVVFDARVGENDQLRAVGWADDTHVAFLLSQAFAPGQVLPDNVEFRGAPRRVEYKRWGVADLTTRRMRLLTTSTSDQAWSDQGARLIAPIEGDAGYARLVGFGTSDDNHHASVFRIPLDSGRALPALVGGVNRDTINYVFDAQGNVIARVDSNEATNHWSIFAYDNGAPRPLLDGDSATGQAPFLAGALADGRLVESDWSDDGFQNLYAIDRNTGAKTLLAQHAGYDVDSEIIDPWTRLVVGDAWIEAEEKQEFYDQVLQAAYARIMPMFNGSARIVSWSRDRQHILVYGERGLDGGGYYVFDVSTGALARIFYRYPDIAAAQRGDREALTYRARDGARVPAYLTMPREGARGLPLVVLVHGGPGDRDTFDFDWWAVFLASRGYAVLQPNFRGSTGYGAAWEAAGYGQWGGLMQTDVEDGVAALGRAGIIDPARVCIVGASYGGYAALAGATLTPDLYKCAVSVAGLSDLPAFLLQRQLESGRRSIQSDYWRLSIGDRDSDSAHLRSISPINLVNQVRAPILLIHGTDDAVVPIDQSRRMRDRLVAAGKQVRYVELRGDDHYLSDAATRTQMLQEIEAFLAQNLPVRPPN